MTTVNVSNEDIVAALGTSERFPVGSRQFELFAPFVGHLVEIAGQDRLGDVIELGAMADVANRYLDWLATNEDFLGKLGVVREVYCVKGLYHLLSTRLKVISMDPVSAAALHGLTPEDYMLWGSTYFELNQAARDLVDRGELTFAKLLTTSPAAFVHGIEW